MKLSSKYAVVSPILITLLLTLTNCAALKNFRTSREVVIENPPYYHGKIPDGVPDTGNIGHFPVIIDDRIAREFDADGWDNILSDMNTFLQLEKFTLPVAPLLLPPSAGPDVYIGSPGMMGAPINESSYLDDDDEVLPMVAYSRDPSNEWKAAVNEVCTAQNLDYVIVYYLGISEYMIHQKDWLGKKEIALGTGYKKPVKWLTGLEDPVEVFHVTAALIDTEGRIKRIGAEGVLAAKTASFFESIIGVRNALGDKVISQITTDVFRQDLPGNPLAFKVALQNLTAKLIGQKELIIKPKK